MNHEAIVFDTETTGREKSTIIEVAWLSLRAPSEGLGIQMDFQMYFNPAPIEIEWGAMATHHILPHELMDCTPSREFELPKGVKYLIGHNIDFDWEVSGQPDVKRICTLALSRWLWPNLDGHSQSALYYWLMDARAGSSPGLRRNNLEHARETLKNAHSALVDVRICRDILDAQVYELTARGHVIDTWEHLWELSELARIPTVMAFGKHKGEKIEDVPASYVSWYMKQEDKDPYVVKAFEKAKAGAGWTPATRTVLR